MNGLTVFSHSFRQVFGNLGVAIKMSAWLVAFYMMVSLWAVTAFPEWTEATMAGDAEAAGRAFVQSDSSIGMFIFAVFVFIIFSAWGISVVAIAWHRFILLEEKPTGLIPYRKDFRVGRYFWHGLGIALLATLVVSLVSGILGLAFGPFFLSTLEGGSQQQGAGVVGASFVWGILIGAIMTVIYLRMALILPAVALDTYLTLGHAWQETAGNTAALAVLALVLAFINAVGPLVINLVLSGLPMATFGAYVLFQWFYFMLNISVLSTLYGHIVQKREVY